MAPIDKLTLQVFLVGTELSSFGVLLFEFDVDVPASNINGAVLVCCT